MKRRASLLFAALLCQAPGSAVVAQDSRIGDASHWFYMVKSRPSDPASEAEYNTWYDDIDIPITRVHEVVVRMTLIQGEVVYKATADGK